MKPLRRCARRTIMSGDGCARYANARGKAASDGSVARFGIRQTGKFADGGEFI
jgi:hypothetical protein